MGRFAHLLPPYALSAITRLHATASTIRASERSHREVEAIVRDGGLGRGTPPESMLSTMM